MRRALALPLIVVIVLLVAVAAAAAADSLSGTWSANANSPQGPVPFKLTLTLAEKAVTGTISSDMGSDAITDGTFDGETLSFNTTYNGMAVSMTAKLADGKLAGTFSVNGGEASGDWAATREAQAQ